MALVHNNYPATSVAPGATIMETTVRMTTTTANGGSRLAQMQARFQQKQLQEKEQKLLRLYESQQQRAFQRVAARGSAGSSSVSSNSSNVSVGKVRQMFDERRANGSTGWDRSYPLEPLDGSLNKSRGTVGQPTVTKTKATRVASLDRSQNNNLQVSKTNIKRSKSHARGGVTTEVNGSFRKQQQHNSVDADYNSSFRTLTIEENQNGGYRKLNNTERFSESFRVQPDEEEFDDNIDNFGGSYKNQNQTEELNESYRRQETTTSRVFQRDHYEDIDYEGTADDDQQLNGNQTFTVIDDKKREDLFAKYQVRDVENNELLSASPPPELFDDDEVDDSFVFKKLPNVGGPLLLEEPTKPSDKFKTYNASKPNKKMAPPAAESKKGAGVVRKETVSPPPKAATRAAARRVENKVTTPPGGARRPAGTTVTRQSSTPPAKTTTSSSTMPKGTVKKLTPTASQPVRSPSQTTSVKSATSRKSAMAPSTRDDLAECPICERRFAADRIAVHQKICQRTSKKKRKIFDATKHRVSGTEAETYVKRLAKQKPEPKQTKKDDWRKKHEDFIMTIRAAKQAQAHIKAGGSIKDLPPPPPLDTSDYIQCPHCQRRFNDAAAERHIPRCANMLHNKPKPGAAAARASKRR